MVMSTAMERCLATCTQGRCDSTGQCRTNVGPCGNGIVDPPEQCDDGNDFATDSCFECKRTFCGDQHIQPLDEDCEVGVAVGLRVWSNASCNGRCKRTIYTTCESYRDCNNQPCVAGVCSPTTCPYERLDICPLPACPLMPDFAAGAVFAHCLPVPLREEQPCPSGLVRVQMETGPLCIGRAFGHLKSFAEVLEVSKAPNEGFVLAP
ncbi:MAG: DUF4215 domain-containing protein [Polyangiales bacterium]